MKPKAVKTKAFHQALHGIDVDEDFVCPECGVGKEDFEMVEIG